MAKRLSAYLITLSWLFISAATFADDQRLDVVYHLSDEAKVGFTLNNIRNHLAGAGGPDQVNIVVVSHGPAVKRFIDIDGVRNAVASLREQGVSFEACANTLKALDVEPNELLSGFSIAEQGGVTRIAELQSEGFVYLRP